MTNKEVLIAGDPSTSQWLKEQINKIPERDIVDFINDVEALSELLNERLFSLTKK